MEAYLAIIISICHYTMIIECCKSCGLYLTKLQDRDTVAIQCDEYVVYYLLVIISPLGSYSVCSNRDTETK